jgi:hypothetical protein
MLLAARALGLGATLTTLYLQFEKEAEAALGLPPNVHSYALLPIGYPMGRFGPVRRIALADVVYEDRWGEPYRDLLRSATAALQTKLGLKFRALRETSSDTHALHNQNTVILGELCQDESGPLHRDGFLEYETSLARRRTNPLRELSGHVAG